MLANTILLSCLSHIAFSLITFQILLIGCVRRGNPSDSAEGIPERSGTEDWAPKCIGRRLTFDSLKSCQRNSCQCSNTVQTGLAELSIEEIFMLVLIHQSCRGLATRLKYFLRSSLHRIGRPLREVPWCSFHLFHLRLHQSIVDCRTTFAVRSLSATTLACLHRVASTQRSVRPGAIESFNPSEGKARLCKCFCKRSFLKRNSLCQMERIITLQNELYGVTLHAIEIGIWKTPDSHGHFEQTLLHSDKNVCKV